MLESLFNNVFGKPKSKSSTRNSQDNSATSGPSNINQQPGAPQMTGPFSSNSQMPQPPSLPYPVAPYPNNPGASSSYYPPLPFSRMPEPYNDPSKTSTNQPFNYPTGTLASQQTSPLDSVPFEFKLSLNSSTNLVSLDQLFKEIKNATSVVDRADAYLRSSQSDYDFKVEQSIINQ